MLRRTALAGLVACTGACSDLAFFAANVPASFGSFERRADIAYGADPKHRLDLYLPTAPAASLRSMVVFYYGGRWEAGDKAQYRFVGAALAGLGLVAVLPNYRHYPRVKMAGFMEDAAQAALWASTHAAQFKCDPGRFYLMGHSAGAHLAALVTLDKRHFAATGRLAPRIAGVIGLSGPYDFLPLTDPDLQDMFGPPEKYRDSQPINFVRPDAPPMLLVHGLKDTTVKPRNSINFAAALRSTGVQATLRLYPDLAHADTVAALSIPARRRGPTLRDIESFLHPVGLPQSS